MTSAARDPLTIVLTNDAPAIAGGEQYVLYVARGMRERGHRVVIAPLAGSQLDARARDLGYETIGIPYASRGREFARASMLVRALRGRHPDVIHTNSNIDRTVGAIAARILGCASVASVHSCLSIRHNLTHWIRNRYLVDRFLPVGHSTAEILTGHDRIDAARVTVVHIGIPADAVTRDPGAGAAVRAEFGVPDDAVLLVNLARLVEFKGHAFLVASFPELLRGAPHASCIVAGDGELREPLERRARELGVDGRIRFAGHRTDVDALLSAADIYVQPSIDRGGETFPVAILQAMAAGLPVVASNVGDIRHMVADGDNGVLLREKDTAGLAAALASLAGDRGRRISMGARSREIFREKFTLDVMIRRIEDVYRGVARS